jgi:type II secretory pathway pseudopilin PulG
MNPNGGFALTELLIALGVVAGILAAIAGVAATLQSSAGASDHVRQIETIAQNLGSIYTRSSNFSGLTQTVARDLQVFPGQMDDGTAVYNTWNGAVTVAAATDLSGNANRAFTITTEDIPEDVCSDLASNTAGARQVQVGGTSVYEVNNRDLDVAAIATGCSGGADVTYLYEKK